MAHELKNGSACARHHCQASVPYGLVSCPDVHAGGAGGGGGGGGGGWTSGHETTYGPGWGHEPGRGSVLQLYMYVSA